jgi:type IV secretory pathway VirJ component
MFDTSALSAVLTGIQSQQPQPLPPAPAPATTTGPLANLQSILTGGADYGSIIRQIGGGMANMGPTGGDPFLAFAQGFGGTQQYATQQEKEAAERAAALQKQQMDANLALQRLTQDQSQFDASLANNQSQFNTRTTQDQAQFDQRMELEKAADKRAEQIAADNRRKTDAEILRLAKREGLTVDQTLRINDAAQKATENIIDPSERRAAYDAEVDRLTQMAKSSRLSDGPGVTEADVNQPYLMNDAGEKLVLSADGKSWVPAQ